MMIAEHITEEVCRGTLTDIGPLIWRVLAMTIARNQPEPAVMGLLVAAIGHETIAQIFGLSQHRMRKRAKVQW